MALAIIEKTNGIVELGWALDCPCGNNDGVARDDYQAAVRAFNDLGGLDGLLPGCDEDLCAGYFGIRIIEAEARETHEMTDQAEFLGVSPDEALRALAEQILAERRKGRGDR